MEFQFDHIAQQVPSVEDAISWWQKTVPGTEILYQDKTWGLIQAGGTKLAFVMEDQHPNHIAWRVSNTELERVAAEQQLTIMPHRDNTRSIYMEAPGGHALEIIAYPESDTN